MSEQVPILDYGKPDYGKPRARALRSPARLFSLGGFLLIAACSLFGTWADETNWHWGGTDWRQCYLIAAGVLLALGIWSLVAGVRNAVDRRHGHPIVSHHPDTSQPGDGPDRNPG
jgi:hypothetical protein